MGASLYALVDMSGLPQLGSYLHQMPTLPARNLFESTNEHAARHVAPVLLGLGALQQPMHPQARCTLDWLLERCRHNHALTLMRSPLKLNDLAEALIKRMDAELPDRMRVLLRYFDTRVLVALTHVLQGEQAKAFFGVADLWCWLDRDGVLQRLATAIHPDAAQMTAPWPLSAVQESQLLDAAEPDAVIQLMKQVAHDVCSQTAPGVLHATVRSCLPEAKSRGVDDPREQALFCLTELAHGPRFYAQPKWQAAWANLDEDGSGFLGVLQRMESDL